MKIVIDVRALTTWNMCLPIWTERFLECNCLVRDDAWLGMYFRVVRAGFWVNVLTLQKAENDSVDDKGMSSSPLSLLSIMQVSLSELSLSIFYFKNNLTESKSNNWCTQPVYLSTWE